MNSEKKNRILEMRKNDSLISKAQALILLDEIDSLRRDKENSRESIDFVLRLAAATIAGYAGYKSRREWTEDLLNDDNSLYRYDHDECWLSFHG